MKAKQPGFLFEHLARAVRSEGPVRITLPSSEAQLSSSVSPPSTLTSGTPARRRRNRPLPLPRRRRRKMKKMTNWLVILYGTTGSTWPLAHFVLFKTSWLLSLRRLLSTEPLSTSATREPSAHTRTTNKVWMEWLLTKIGRCWSTTSNPSSTRAIIDRYWTQPHMIYSEWRSHCLDGWRCVKKVSGMAINVQMGVLPLRIFTFSLLVTSRNWQMSLT